MSLVIINEDDDQYIKLAKRYCNLSNAHDLQSISEMVHKDATIYGHHDIGDIMKGMKTFRVLYPNVSWVFHKFHRIGKIFNNDIKQLVTRVSFTFDRYWNMKGGRLKCTATEFIDFNNDGLMMSIGYIDGPSEPIPSVYEGINEINSNDVIGGRGSSINEHPGNQQYRQLVIESISFYQAATSKREKRTISEGIVDKIHNFNPPGRFLIKSLKYETGYIEMTIVQAVDKTCAAFKFHEKYTDPTVEVLTAITGIKRILNSAKAKTELCRHYTTHKSCVFGDKCTYAHGEHELLRSSNGRNDDDVKTP